MSTSEQTSMDAVRAMYYAHEKYDDQDTYDHALRVADMVPPECKVAAWLHDVLEDTPVTIDQLTETGVSDTDCAALFLLTRRGDETYEHYIERLVVGAGKAGVIARRVKEADLLDNLTRSLRGGEQYISLTVRYRKALSRVQQEMLGP